MSTSNRPFSKIGGGGGGRNGQMLQGRRTSLLVAAISAVLAAALIYLFVSQYHNTSAPPATVATNETVWVAKAYIAPGTPYNDVIAQGLLQRESVPSGQAVAGAITDPSVIAGQVVKTAVAAGQQVTAIDFSATAKPSLGSYLKGAYRAVAFGLDSEHGLTGYLRAGDYVDVMGQTKVNNRSVSELLAQDIQILANAGGVVILRLTDKQSLLLTAASGKYALWLSLRPGRGATQSIRLGDAENL